MNCNPIWYYLFFKDNYFKWNLKKFGITNKKRRKSSYFFMTACFYVIKLEKDF